MATNIFRRLDELAGVAGGVVAGERARKEQLLSEHLGRSQQSYLQRQRQTGMRQLQEARLRRDESELTRRLAQNQQQFETREHRMRTEFGEEMDLSRDRLAAMKARNLRAQTENERDEVARQLDFIDANIEQLNDQVRNTILSQSDKITGTLSEEGRTTIRSLNAQKNDMIFKKNELAREFALPAMRDKMRDIDSILQGAKIRAIDEEQKRFQSADSRRRRPRPSLSLMPFTTLSSHNIGAVHLQIFPPLSKGNPNPSQASPLSLVL